MKGHSTTKQSNGCGGGGRVATGNLQHPNNLLGGGVGEKVKVCETTRTYAALEMLGTPPLKCVTQNAPLLHQINSTQMYSSIVHFQCTGEYCCLVHKRIFLLGAPASARPTSRIRPTRRKKSSRPPRISPLVRPGGAPSSELLHHALSASRIISWSSSSDMFSPSSRATACAQNNAAAHWTVWNKHITNETFICAYLYANTCVFVCAPAL